MSQYTVTPAELTAAGSAVSRDADPISTAAAGVQSSSGAADDTPAVAAYATLLSDAAKTLATIQTGVSGLGQGLTQAATNYEQAEEANLYGYGTGGY